METLFGLRTAVTANGFDGTAFHGFLALGLFFWSGGLFKDVGIAAIIIASEVIRSRLAAEIAIDALVIDVVLSASVLGVAICNISHKCRKECCDETFK